SGLRPGGSASEPQLDLVDSQPGGLTEDRQGAGGRVEDLARQVQELFTRHGVDPLQDLVHRELAAVVELLARQVRHPAAAALERQHEAAGDRRDRKSTRLNSSHVAISYAVFCLKK